VRFAEPIAGSHAYWRARGEAYGSRGFLLFRHRTGAVARQTKPGQSGVAAAVANGWVCMAVHPLDERLHHVSAGAAVPGMARMLGQLPCVQEAQECCLVLLSRMGHNDVA